MAHLAAYGLHAGAPALAGQPQLLSSAGGIPTSSNVLFNPIMPDLKSLAWLTGMKVDTSKHHHIFVGDLSNEVDEMMLRNAFISFGEISEVKIIRDPHTMKSKGYGFVTFINKQEAENAITNMHGQWVGNRQVRTNWATRKPQINETASTSPRKHEFDDIFKQSSDSNTTVYIGNGLQNLTEELMRSKFEKFGEIQEIRVFKEKGYGFVRFGTKDMATQAICQMNGEEMAGQVMKCSWGKESSDDKRAQSGDGGLTAAMTLGLTPGLGLAGSGLLGGSTSLGSGMISPSLFAGGLPSAGLQAPNPAALQLPPAANPAGTLTQNWSNYQQQMQLYYQILGQQQQAAGTSLGAQVGGPVIAPPTTSTYANNMTGPFGYQGQPTAFL